MDLHGWLQNDSAWFVSRVKGFCNISEDDWVKGITNSPFCFHTFLTEVVYLRVMTASFGKLINTVQHCICLGIWSNTGKETNNNILRDQTKVKQFYRRIANDNLSRCRRHHHQENGVKTLRDLKLKRNQNTWGCLNVFQAVLEVCPLIKHE